LVSAAQLICNGDLNMVMSFKKVIRGKWRTIDLRYEIIFFNNWWILMRQVDNGEYLATYHRFKTLKAAKAYIIDNYY
jgi:hypothetical protein